MTRKDYITIAAAIAQARQATEIKLDSRQRPSALAGLDAIKLTAIGLASHLKQDNPSFDRSRFFAACGF